MGNKPGEADSGALLIDNTPNDSLINSKAEWGHNSDPRLRIEADEGPHLVPKPSQQLPDHQVRTAKSLAEEPDPIPAKKAKYQMTDYFKTANDPRS